MLLKVITAKNAETVTIDILIMRLNLKNSFAMVAVIC